MKHFSIGLLVLAGLLGHSVYGADIAGNGVKKAITTEAVGIGHAFIDNNFYFLGNTNRRAAIGVSGRNFAVYRENGSVEFPFGSVNSFVYKLKFGDGKIHKRGPYMVASGIRERFNFLTSEMFTVPQFNGRPWRNERVVGVGGGLVGSVGERTIVYLCPGMASPQSFVVPDGPLLGLEVQAVDCGIGVIAFRYQTSDECDVGVVVENFQQVGRKYKKIYEEDAPALCPFFEFGFRDIQRDKLGSRYTVTYWDPHVDYLYKGSNGEVITVGGIITDVTNNFIVMGSCRVLNEDGDMFFLKDTNGSLLEVDQGVSPCQIAVEIGNKLKVIGSIKTDPDINEEIVMHTFRVTGGSGGNSSINAATKRQLRKTIAKIKRRASQLKARQWRRPADKRQFLLAANRLLRVVKTGNITRSRNVTVSILRRIDGCGRRPDANDYVTDCRRQKPIAKLTRSIINRLDRI